MLGAWALPCARARAPAVRGKCSCGFLEERAVLAFLDGRAGTLEVVMTRRGPSEALCARADYIHGNGCPLVRPRHGGGDRILNGHMRPQDIKKAPFPVHSRFSRDPKWSSGSSTGGFSTTRTASRFFHRPRRGWTGQGSATSGATVVTDTNMALAAIEVPGARRAVSLLYGGWGRGARGRRVTRAAVFK